MPSWVYGIINNQTKECVYIGSTTGKYFCIRKCDHMKPSTQINPRPIHNYVKENGNWNNFSFIILHHYETIDKIDLLTQEKNEINTRKPICNVLSPLTTIEERREAKRISNLKWRHSNPDKVANAVIKRNENPAYITHVKERCSTKINCECGGTYTAQNKSNHCNRNIHKEYIKSLVKPDEAP